MLETAGRQVLLPSVSPWKSYRLALAPAQQQRPQAHLCEAQAAATSPLPHSPCSARQPAPTVSDLGAHGAKLVRAALCAPAPGVVLPVVYVLANAIATALFKDALILKVGVGVGGWWMCVCVCFCTNQWAHLGVGLAQTPTSRALCPLPQASCPNCGATNTTYFGDILTVPGEPLAATLFRYILPYPCLFPAECRCPREGRSSGMRSGAGVSGDCAVLHSCLLPHGPACPQAAQDE